ncbi:hypothetical protein GYMLUDRAFT_65014 [Collybiopsis luxurians FD-317 M1]|uniref:Uncharacterized protein n=1 Tax=Collybiopsis luxurians FD-317 M1 TaxID=944289 RepID=A0A0D0BNL5_9AGAR|nr:hypothetical protein GYMLUDRAFT_65014 [Collybiopsis luxurians FD-317 M1]
MSLETPVRNVDVAISACGFQQVADVGQEDNISGEDGSMEAENESADKQYTESLQAKIESQLASQYSEHILEFRNMPSPGLPFIYPDPVSILQFNLGQFALKIEKACNHRFLKNESQFCSLLRNIQKLPSEQS